MKINRIIKFIGDNITTSKCMGCYSAVNRGEYVCNECAADFNKARVKAPKAVRYHGKKYLITGVFKYNSIAGSTVKSLKFSKHYQCAEGMGAEIAKKLERKRIRQIDYITYVPMTAGKEAKRGLNHTKLISGIVSERLGIKHDQILKKTYETKEQHKLSGSDRKKNLFGVFKVKKNVSGKTIVVIDDVCTTGTTLCECARVLYENGAKQVVLISFCLT